MLRILLFLALLASFSCERKEVPRMSPAEIKELVGVKGCPYCHDMRRQLLGPSFLDISKRYTERDRDKLVKSILEGSRGKWGDNSMPPQKLTEEEARLIVEWILNLKHELD